MEEYRKSPLISDDSRREFEGIKRRVLEERQARSAISAPIVDVRPLSKNDIAKIVEKNMPVKGQKK